MQITGEKVEAATWDVSAGAAGAKADNTGGMAKSQADAGSSFLFSGS